MAGRNFTQAQPNISQGREVNASGFVRGIERRADRIQQERALRLQYASQFDVVRMDISGEGAKIADAAYQDVLNSQVAYQQAIQTYGINSEQASTIREVYEGQKKQYIQAKNMGDELNSVYSMAEETAKNNKIADRQVFKGAIAKNILDGTPDYTSGKISLNELTVNSFDLSEDDAYMSFPIENIQAALIPVISGLKQEAIDVSNERNVPNGSVTDTTTFKFIPLLAKMDGALPEVDDNGRVIMDINDDTINAFFATINPDGNAEKSFNYDYKLAKEDGSELSREEYFIKRFDLEKLAGQYSLRTSRERTPLNSWQTSIAKEGDYMEFLEGADLVLNAFNLKRAGNEDALRNAKEVLARIGSFKSPSGNVARLDLAEAEKVEPIGGASELAEYFETNEGALEYLASKMGVSERRAKATISEIANQEGDPTGRDKQKISQAREAYEEYEKANNPRYKDRLVVIERQTRQGRVRDVPVQEIPLDEAGAFSTVAQSYMQGYQDRSDKIRYDNQALTKLMNQYETKFPQFQGKRGQEEPKNQNKSGGPINFLDPSYYEGE